MAEAECIDKATPIVKRSRIDSGSSYQGKNKIRRTAMSDELRNEVHLSIGTNHEVTSSTDSHSGEMFGCDSGFQDLTPPTSATDCTFTFANVCCSDSSGFKDINDGGEACDTQDDIQSSFPSVTTTYYGDKPFEEQPAEGELCEDPCSSDDAESTVSEISGLSDLSDLSGQEWKPVTGPVSWVQRQMNLGADPRDILRELIPRGTLIPLHLDEVTLWKIIVNMLSEPPRRNKLTCVNTIDDVVQLLRKCQKIVILTGAGVSVSCGIPDFRSQDGIYARLSKDFPDLPDPQAMFDIHYFRKDPRPFFKFAKEIYPGQFQPSLSHKFIRLVEQHGKLLTNYTQNIDTLEQAAGIQRVITCHGSFATATCTRCKFKVGCAEIKDDIFNQRIPFCTNCQQDSEELAVMKPDIVFFGEGLSGDFHQAMARDKNECDLLIVMGSSLKVRPVALIPSSLSPHVPQILINREPLHHLVFDVELLGDCDVIVAELCRRLGGGWDHLCADLPPLQELTDLPDLNESDKPKHSECNNNQAEPSTPSIDGVDVQSKSSDNRTKDGTAPESSSPLPTEDTGPPKIRDDASEAKPSSEIYPADSTSDNPERELAPEECDDWKESQWHHARESISSRLPEHSYLSVPPARYVFHGAEVYLEDDRPNARQTYDQMADDSNSDASSVTCFMDSEEDLQKVIDDGADGHCEVRVKSCSCAASRSEDSKGELCCHTTSLEATLDDGDSGYAASKSSDVQYEPALGCS